MLELSSNMDQWSCARLYGGPEDRLISCPQNPASALSSAKRHFEHSGNQRPHVSRGKLVHLEYIIYILLI